MDSLMQSQAPRTLKDALSRMEVSGQAVMSIVQGMDVVQARALRMLADNGISPLKPDAWYALPAVLASFQRIFEQIGPVTVRAIGRKIPDSAPFPQDIDSLEKALCSLDAAYRMNHRGPGPIGAYRCESGPAPRSARVVSDTPYPCDMDMGLVEAMADRFRPTDALWMRLEHAPGACRKRGDAACTYHLSW
jgi:hypothetical protein